MQPMANRIAMGMERAEYTICIAGCGKQWTYIVLLQTRR
jgi:hypothetical protein